MLQKTLIRILLVIALLADIALLQFLLAFASYDVLSVTPLFFLHFANYLFPFSISLAAVGVFTSIVMKDIILLKLSSLTLYFIVFLAPYNAFSFTIYNDQLGFAVETLYGLHYGFIAPNQGEYSTLGHAFFTSIVGKILGLNLFQTTRFVEVVFMLAVFIAYLSLAMTILRKGGKSFLVATAIMIFPAFILDPLVYSRSYFSLVVSTFLFLCIFKFMDKKSAENFVLATITFITSSISYPVQPLIVAIALVMFTSLSRFIASPIRNKQELHRTLLKALMFFMIWSTIQVYIGKASWGVLHVIILKAMKQEYFEGLEHPAFRYVGEAAVYINLRILMVATGWLIAAFILLVFFLNFLRNRRVSDVEFFSFLLLVSFCFFGVIYGTTLPDPALKFYRSLIAVIPFTLVYMRGKITVGGHQKIILTLLLAITTVFVILSPVTKWGWTFTSYPTEHDLALYNYILSHYEFSPKKIIYAPGSHYLLGVFGFKVKAMQTGVSMPEVYTFFDAPEVYTPYTDHFDISTAMKTNYTATFYRMFIYPRWFGVDINTTINEVRVFASEANLLYSDGGLWLLIGTTT